ncbi:protein adenylyltransferase SelO [Nocardioides litoris]|uniref:protein adenylyltransferase SelO n=1 Tax=Nocardioides litoris TaxID=1926648 RepID=UPI0011217EBB|nr:YdiU family protein [Nocardioides litoris]
MGLPTLGHRFADELPELALPWQAEEVAAPQLLVLNEPLAAELGLDVDWLRSPDGLRFLVGGLVPEGARPVAQGYAGHQFGGWSPRLGDGRALLLGELTDREGRRRDLHLKGSGRTPFARGGDGRAAVGPMLREHVVSEAMHALGVPTTRSLAVVATGREVQREVPLPGALLVRVASSHLRVGSFQYARALEAQHSGDRSPGVLQRLLDHAIDRHHPDAAKADRPALALLEAVAAAQARLVAAWMQLGFVHGVMNTDNVTISGETIDYGPCAFLDVFDVAASFSSIDEGGRYAYGNQPAIAEWDLARLAEALLPLVEGDGVDEAAAIELATASLGTFRTAYAEAWDDGWARKLGLGADGAGGSEEVKAVVAGLTDLMRADRVDLTSFLVALADGRARDLVLDLAAHDAWHARWQALGPDVDLMRRTNPVRIPRNHLVQEALDAATAGDLGPLGPLLAAVTSPYDVDGSTPAGMERYAEPAPDSFGDYTTYCGT